MAARPEKHKEDRARAIAVPDWVPAAVTRVAPLLPGPTQRLLHDDRMKSVWRELRRRAPEDVADRLCENERERLHLLIEAADLQEQDVLSPDLACVAFFISVAWIIGNPGGRYVWTKAHADQQARQWKNAAECCRRVADEPMFARHRAAAAKMASFFEEHASSLRNRGHLANLDPQIKAYVLDRSSRLRGDDKIRGYTRPIAVDARRIFGKFLYGTVATVATVALEKTVSQKSVENWCTDLQLSAGDQVSQ